NRSAYMDFKKATDDLFAGISHEDLARALGVSVAAIRQARLDPKAKAYRTAPANWTRAVLALAQRQAARYQELIEELCGESDEGNFLNHPGRAHKRRGRTN